MTEAKDGFQVELENFSGPFDLLLSLIHKRKLDITDVALAEVTDEFIAYVTALSNTPHDNTVSTQALDQLSYFLVVAATLLDLKTARLLPRGEVEDDVDLELLEARDLLFARLLQYRAYKAVSAELAQRLATVGRSVGRTVELEEAFRAVLPPLVITATPDMLAAVYAAVLARDTTVPTVGTDHIHLPKASVAEQRTFVLGLIAQRGQIDFELLSDTAPDTLTVVARFLALLELFKVGLCELEQDHPLGPLRITATGRTVPNGAAATDGAEQRGQVDPVAVTEELRENSAG